MKGFEVIQRLIEGGSKTFPTPSGLKRVDCLSLSLEMPRRIIRLLPVYPCKSLKNTEEHCVQSSCILPAGVTIVRALFTPLPQIFTYRTLDQTLAQVHSQIRRYFFSVKLKVWFCILRCLNSLIRLRCSRPTYHTGGLERPRSRLQFDR